MMESMRWLAGLLLLVLVAFCGLYVAAGRSAPPHLTIVKPDRFVGQASSLDVTAEAPDARLTALTGCQAASCRRLENEPLPSGPTTPSAP